MLIGLRRGSRPVPLQDQCQVGQIVMQTSQQDSRDIWIDPRTIVHEIVADSVWSQIISRTLPEKNQKIVCPLFE